MVRMTNQSKLKKNNVVFTIIIKLFNQSFYEAKYRNSLKVAEVIKTFFMSGKQILQRNYGLTLMSNLNQFTEKNR